MKAWALSGRMSLRMRFIVTYALLTAVVCGLFATLMFFTLTALEGRLVDDRLATQGEWLIKRFRSGQVLDTSTGLQLLQGELIPAEMRGLTPGFHEWVQDGKSLHILMRDEGGNRFVILDKQSGLVAIEEIVLLALAGGVVATLLMAIIFGYLTVNPVVAPLTDLARAVQQAVPPDDLPSLNESDEIGVLARAFAQRAGALEQFLERERRSTDEISHELRTPLTVIVGASEVLATHALRDPGLRGISERIARAAGDATERITALLLLARAPQTLDAPHTALAPLIRREIERCAPFLSGKAVTLQTDIDDAVHAFAHPELVSMVISNLVRNACQYTDHGTIAISLSADAILIEDTGPGLPPSIRARPFGAFARGPAEHLSGAGLGLSITERCAAHLGWTLVMEDRVDGGTRATLQISERIHTPIGNGLRLR